MADGSDKYELVFNHRGGVTRNWYRYKIRKNGEDVFECDFGWVARLRLRRLVKSKPEPDGPLVIDTVRVGREGEGR
jgi:hypothetical protein